jgi:hypothetical protein
LREENFGVVGFLLFIGKEEGFITVRGKRIVIKGKAVLDLKNSDGDVSKNCLEIKLFIYRSI